MHLQIEKEAKSKLNNFIRLIPKIVTILFEMENKENASKIDLQNRIQKELKIFEEHQF